MLWVRRRSCTTMNLLAWTDCGTPWTCIQPFLQLIVMPPQASKACCNAHGITFTLCKPYDTITERGQASSTHMKSLTTHIQRAPISKPWRVQMLWGIISPNTKMMMVEVTRPIAPVVRSASRMDRALLIKVFPNSKVHNNKLPLFLTGKIVLACCLSSGSPPSTRICKILLHLETSILCIATDESLL